MTRWWIVALMLVAAAAGFAFLAFGALRNLWTHGDSPTYVYVVLGTIWVVLAVASLHRAYALLLRRR